MGEKGKGFTMLPMKSIPRVVYFFFIDENHFGKKNKMIFEKNIGIQDL
jgi:hypothetical protein